MFQLLTASLADYTVPFTSQNSAVIGAFSSSLLPTQFQIMNLNTITDDAYMNTGIPFSQTHQ